MPIGRLRPFLTLAFGLLLAAELAAFWREASRHRQLTAGLRSAQTRSADLQAGLKAAESQRKKLENATASLRYQLAYLPGADQSKEAQRQARRNLARIALEYGGFVHGLRLPPEQQRRLEAALAERKARETDIRRAAAVQGLSASDSSIAALLHQEQARAQTVVMELIGPEGTAQLDDFERSAPIRGTMKELAKLAYDVPLSADQERQLTSLLQQSSPSYAAGGPANDFGAAESDPLLARARQFLSADQLNAFRLAYAGSQSDYGIRARIAELQAQGVLPKGIDEVDP